MRFQCPHCRGIVDIEDADMGQAVACGHCGNAVAVPISKFDTGAVVGDCVIKKELGEGGMGTVYLAHQLSLDRPVALKVLHPQFSEDRAYIADFIREARAAARLNHAGIVQAYAVGEDNGVYFFAMEYVEGSTLKEVLTHGGRIVVDRALEIVGEIAAALDFAWTNQRLVHRDIKPDNIILTRDGKTKLADLGLARIVGDVRNDGTEALFGTPQYISPEQLLGQPGDNRSDIYSLGATLYHALTGRFPYTGDTATDIARSHLAEELTPVRDVVPDIPTNVAQVAEIMLAKRPAHRYQDAEELLADIERVREGRVALRQPVPEAQEPIDFLGDGECEDSAEPAAAVQDAPPVAKAIGPPDPLRSIKKAQPVAEVVELDAPSATAKGLKIRTATSTKSKVIKVSTAAEGKISTARVPKATPVEGQADEDASGNPMLWVLVIGLVVAAVAAGVIAWVLLRGPGGERETQVSAMGDTPREQTANEIRQLTREGKGAQVVLPKLAHFYREYGEQGNVQDELRQLTAHLVEEDLRSLREIIRNIELQRWEEKRKELEEERLTQEETARLERIAAQKRREEEDKQRRVQQQRDDYRFRLEERQKAVRWDAANLCREGKFSEAMREFVPLAGAQSAQFPDIAEEFRTWAESKQTCVEYAIKALELVQNTRDKLRGVRYVLPGKHGYRVYHIGPRTLDVAQRSHEFVKGESIEVWGPREGIRLVDVPAQRMWDLCKEAAEKDGVAEAQLNLYFGCFLLARAEFLDTARSKLLAGAGEEAELFLSELELMAQEVKAKEFEQLMDRLRLLVVQGDKQQLQKLLQFLRARHPDLYNQHEQTINRLLQEL